MFATNCEIILFLTNYCNFNNYVSDVNSEYIYHLRKSFGERIS